MKELLRDTSLGVTSKSLYYFIQNFKRNRNLNNKEDIVFLWVPKSSGSTIFAQMSKNFEMQHLKSVSRFLCFPNTGAITPGHISWLSLIESGLVSRDYHKKAYKFTVVRNPYDRTASLYNYLTQGGVNNLCFDKFLENIYFRRPPIGFFNVVGLSQTNPQTDWLIDGKGDFLADEIFKIEELSILEKSFKDRFGVKIDTDERKKVSAKKINGEDIISNMARVEIVNSIYKADFVNFGYRMIET